MTENDDTVAAPSVGDRLREARESQGLTLEDIAAQTRIPLRHLEAIEAAEWDRLPAPTYTVGFAKSYASTLGLDRTEIGEQIRMEAGSPRSAAPPEHFEPVDPARTMPRWLVIGAIAAIVLAVGIMTWLNNRSLEPDPVAPPTAAEQPAGPQTAAPTPAVPAAPSGSGPVMLTATEPVWIQVYERDGRTLFQGELGNGQNYQVPATATAPLLRTGKPEAIRVTVGEAVAPPIGPPARTVSDVSLLGPDLLGVAQAPGTGAAQTAQ